MYVKKNNNLDELKERLLAEILMIDKFNVESDGLKEINKRMINWKNYHGNTALILACINNKISIVELLIDKGVNINQRGKYGMTALMWAAQRGYLDIVKMLVEKGNANVSIVDNLERSAVKHASMNGQKEVADYLMVDLTV